MVRLVTFPGCSAVTYVTLWWEILLKHCLTYDYVRAVNCCKNTCGTRKMLLKRKLTLKLTESRSQLDQVIEISLHDLSVTACGVGNSIHLKYSCNSGCNCAIKKGKTSHALVLLCTLSYSVWLWGHCLNVLIKILVTTFSFERDPSTSLFNPGSDLQMHPCIKFPHLKDLQLNCCQTRPASTGWRRGEGMIFTSKAKSGRISAAKIQLSMRTKPGSSIMVIIVSLIL